MNNNKYPNRKSSRLKNYNYASIGYYFITINAKEWQPIFGEIKNEVMYPTLLGEIIQEEWERVAEIRKNIKLHEYVVMPNHFHAIVEICYSLNKDIVPTKYLAAHSLGAIIGSFKGAVTRQYNILNNGEKTQVWHVRFHDRIIRDERELQNKRRYVLNNVKNWKAKSR